jgi:hypothetical protein
VVATVMVLQALEGLSDREAISALRRDIAWKVACGLRLDDEGFHPTVLVYWPGRLRVSQRPRRLFDAVGQVVQTGVLKGRGRRVLDATVLEDAVATQDTVTQLVAAIRRVRRLVPGAARSSWPPTTMAVRASLTVPGTTLRPPRRWGQDWSTTPWRCLQLSTAWSWATSRPRRGAAGAGRRPRCRAWPAAGQVADRWQSRQGPGHLHRRSQARHAHKTSAHRRDGDKAHIAAEPETGLVTECVLTAANVADGPTGVGLLAGEQPGLEVLGDSAYGGGATRATLRAAGHSQTIKPLPLASAIPGGFTIHDFRIDRSAGILRCPAGATAPITSSGRASLAGECPSCPRRRRCTTAKGGRMIQPHPMRTSCAPPDPGGDPQLPAKLPALAADGGALHRLAGRRWLPAGAYRGIERNDGWWSVRAAAVNLRRLLAVGLAHRDQRWILA